MNPTSTSDPPDASAMSSIGGSSSEQSQYRARDAYDPSSPFAASSGDAQDQSQDSQHKSQPSNDTSTPVEEASPEDISDSANRVASSASRKTTSTPRKTHSVGSKSKGQNMRSHGRSIMKAQGTVSKADDLEFLQSEYPPGEDYPNDDTVETWLRKEGLVDAATGSWKFPKINHEADLYDPLLNIFSKIVERFVTPKEGFPAGVSRKVIKTPNAQLKHVEDGHYSSPDFMAQAEGPSFETPSNGSPFGFANMATFFDAKVDGDIFKNIHIDQMSVYVRQILAHQPNRRFVRCIIISDKHFRLLHFDHAGAQSTEPISLQSKGLFVRVVVGLCSIDECRIGLDDSIQWEIVHGKKDKGTLKMIVGPNKQEKTFELVGTKPFSHTIDIQGRATTCWGVKEPAPEGVIANTFIVKDSWVSEGRTPEHKHLERTRGIPGICELVSWQTRGQTKEYRCASSTSQYYNRIAYRILTNAHGPPVHEFNSVLQLLTALLDAIRAHKALYSIGILHRDISNTNVLLGKKDAAEGYRGILIDLGVAFYYGPDADLEKITKEARSGSRFFQSCTILEYLTKLGKGCPREAPAHDYLDDLEGFFYLLCFIFFLFLPGGAKRPVTDEAISVVEGWDSETAESALPPKALLLSPTRLRKRIAFNIIARSWGMACTNLFKEYLEWVSEIQSEKADLMDAFLENEEEEAETERKTQEDGKNNQGKQAQGGMRSEVGTTQRPEPGAGEELPHNKEGAFAPLLEPKRWKSHYDTIIGFFESAIETVKNIPPPASPSTTAPTVAEPSATKRGRRKSLAAPDVRDKKVPRQKSKCTSKRSQRSEQASF